MCEYVRERERESMCVCFWGWKREYVRDGIALTAGSVS